MFDYNRQSGDRDHIIGEVLEAERTITSVRATIQANQQRNSDIHTESLHYRQKTFELSYSPSFSPANDVGSPRTETATPTRPTEPIESLGKFQNLHLSHHFPEDWQIPNSDHHLLYNSFKRKKESTINPKSLPRPLRHRHPETSRSGRIDLLPVPSSNPQGFRAQLSQSP